MLLYVAVLGKPQHIIIKRKIKKHYMLRFKEIAAYNVFLIFCLITICCSFAPQHLLFGHLLLVQMPRVNTASFMSHKTAAYEVYSTGMEEALQMRKLRFCLRRESS